MRPMHAAIDAAHASGGAELSKAERKLRLQAVARAAVDAFEGASHATAEALGPSARCGRRYTNPTDMDLEEGLAGRHFRSLFGLLFRTLGVRGQAVKRARILNDFYFSTSWTHAMTSTMIRRFHEARYMSMHT